MKQMLMIFLFCQPAMLLLAASITFWPAISLLGDASPGLAWHVAKRIWRPGAEAAEPRGANMQVMKTDEFTAVYLIMPTPK